ncbi:MAG: amidohydrolase [Burkholderiaceae bacterium]
MSAEGAAPAYLPPVASPRRPRLPTPVAACDTHFHVFGPASRFPYASDRAYTPADAPLEAALRMHALLGIERGVLVQGNPYGTDNTALLDALAGEPQRLRGVAIVNEPLSAAQLRGLRDAGVRALRFHHRPRIEGRYSRSGIPLFQSLSRAMMDAGLHAEFFIDARVLPELMPALRDWRLPLVLDHFACADTASIEPLSRLLADGRVWVKLSAAYRFSARPPDYEDVRAVQQALLRANPDRLIWGSDWPHTRLERGMPDDGHLLDLFNDWTGSDELRRTLLVNNPAKLYGFA